MDVSFRFGDRSRMMVLDVLPMVGDYFEAEMHDPRGAWQIARGVVVRRTFSEGRSHIGSSIGDGPIHYPMEPFVRIDLEACEEE